MEVHSERSAALTPTIDVILNTFYQRGITSREQLLTEILRIKKTIENIKDRQQEKILKDDEKLFQFMKKSTEQELGFFPGDRDFFVKVFALCREVDLIEYTLEIYKNDRMGTVIAPANLAQFIESFIDATNPTTILITEAEKHLAGLAALIHKYPQKQFTLTTQSFKMYWMLTLAFQTFQNVKVIQQSIYSNLILTDRFDFIYCLPAFAGKADEGNRRFITNETDGIALENMLPMLSDTGMLSVIVPARVAFSGGSFARLREHIAQNYNIDSLWILPEGTFRPYTAMKTYMLNISNLCKDTVAIGTVGYQKEQFQITDQKLIGKKEFLAQEDWRIELLLSEDDENLQKFKTSNLDKVKLKDVAEVFRGKSILKKDTTLGSISVLNISNIEQGEINYSEMDSIDEEERKIKRYELFEGDVVLSCRGTTIKSAVFKTQAKIIIASANVIVIRPKGRVLGKYIKIFLESPIGLAMIKSFQRGTTIMNINHSDIMEMEIPILPMSEQQEMVKRYGEELSQYKATISEAENRWEKTRNSLYDRFI
ncbi:MAG: restriction endonuclease subunit S [Desulfitobacteriaceae bacterium]|nr:restriction endonuclease subunit S [Desulfitobacteriaceae bacterium]